MNYMLKNNNTVKRKKNTLEMWVSKSWVHKTIKKQLPRE